MATMDVKKLVTKTVEVQVPVVTCCKCGSEASCVPVLQPMQDGRILVALSVVYVPMHIGPLSGLLCEACYKFVSGAVVAMGVNLEAPAHLK